MAGSAARETVAAQLVKERPWSWGIFTASSTPPGCCGPGLFLWELAPVRFKEVMDSHVTAADQLVRQAVAELLKEGSGLAIFFGSGAAVSQPSRPRGLLGGQGRWKST